MSLPQQTSPLAQQNGKPLVAPMQAIVYPGGQHVLGWPTHTALPVQHFDPQQVSPVSQPLAGPQTVCMQPAPGIQQPSAAATASAWHWIAAAMQGTQPHNKSTPKVSQQPAD